MSLAEQRLREYLDGRGIPRLVQPREKRQDRLPQQPLNLSDLGDPVTEPPAVTSTSAAGGKLSDLGDLVEPPGKASADRIRANAEKLIQRSPEQERGANRLWQMGHAGVEAAGELTGLEGVTEFGREGRERYGAAAEAAGEQPKIGDVEDAGGFLQWAKETIGEQIPIMAPSVIGGVAGAVVGGPIGAAIGAFVPNYVLGVGEVQSGIKEKDPEAVAPEWAFAGGSAIAALDSILPGKVGSWLARTFGREAGEEIAKRTLSKPVKEGWVKRGAKGAGQGIAIEGATEALQESIEEVAAAQGADQPIDWESMPEQAMEAGAAGMLMGGLLGGSRVAAGSPAGDPPPPEPAQPFEVPPTLEAEIAGELAGEQMAQPSVDDEIGAALRAERAAQPSPPEAAVAEPPAAAPPSPQPAAETEFGQAETEFGLEAESIDGLPQDQVAILRAAGYGDEDIVDMNPAEREAEVSQAIDQGVTPKLSDLGRPVRGAGDRKSPAKADEAVDVARAAARVAVEPSEAQTRAGNYQHGHLRWQGLPIAIETAKGGTRRGTDPDGEAWETTDFPAHYGRIKRTEGADGDQVDVYIGDNLDAPSVYVIDQVDPSTGRFDEHKAIIGAASPEDAARIYAGSFSDGSGPSRVGGVTEMDVSGFKEWVRSGDTKKPLSKSAAPRMTVHWRRKASPATATRGRMAGL